MIRALVFDLSQTLLFPKDRAYDSTLSALHKHNKNLPTYRFSDFFELNEELLRFLEQHTQGLTRVIFTTGTMHRAPEVAARLQSLFSHIYSGKETGLSKDDPHSFLAIAKELNVKPEEMLFVDDHVPYIAAAQSAGLHVVQYQNNEQAMREITRALS